MYLSPTRPFSGGEEVAGGHVVDVHDREAGVDVGGHAPIQEVDDHPARGGRRVVADADGHGGIHDHHRRAATGEVARHLLGQELGALVVAEHVGEAAGRLLVGGGPVRRRLRQRRDGAGVHDP